MVRSFAYLSSPARSSSILDHSDCLRQAIKICWILLIQCMRCSCIKAGRNLCMAATWEKSSSICAFVIFESVYPVIWLRYFVLSLLGNASAKIGEHYDQGDTINMIIFERVAKSVTKIPVSQITRTKIPQAPTERMNNEIMATTETKTHTKVEQKKS